MVSMKQVAKRAGVSPTTVSHVINHKERVSSQLRKRVELAIDELGYAPNPQAQSLRTGRTNVVALMIPDICNPYYTELVREIQTRLASVGVDTLIYNTDVPGGHSEDHGLEYLRQVRRRRVDGLIVADAALHRIQHELASLKIPAVFVGRLPNNEVDNVEQDGFASAYRMGEYLISKGHRRIAHVTGPSFLRMSLPRQAGFEKALIDGGIDVEDSLRFEGTFLEPSGYAAVEWLLDTHKNDLPSAIFLAGSLMAIGALAAFADRGILIPEDIALATYDVHSRLEHVRPRLTSIGVPPVDMAKAALKLLNDRINGSYTGPAKQVVLKADLQIYSTA